jgi:hypothetical protein
MGLACITHHVAGCHSTESSRVTNELDAVAVVPTARQSSCYFRGREVTHAFDDVASNICQALPDEVWEVAWPFTAEQYYVAVA